MNSTIIQMTKEELKALIDYIVEQKIFELIGDPDEGLPLSDEFVERLKKQRMKVLSGERGKPLDDVLKELGLE